MSSTTMVLVIAGAIAVAAAAIYFATGWAYRRSSGASPTPAAAMGAAAGSQERESASAASTLDPKALGRLRAGREEGRLSEDDIARQNMGPRGRPGEQPSAPNLPENETQIPKPLDPGHTA